jgi:hypothetical protein
MAIAEKKLTPAMRIRLHDDAAYSITSSALATKLVCAGRGLRAELQAILR